MVFIKQINFHGWYVCKRILFLLKIAYVNMPQNSLLLNIPLYVFFMFALHADVIDSSDFNDSFRSE